MFRATAANIKLDGLVEIEGGAKLDLDFRGRPFPPTLKRSTMLVSNLCLTILFVLLSLKSKIIKSTNLFKIQTKSMFFQCHDADDVDAEPTIDFKNLNLSGKPTLEAAQTSSK